MFKAVTDMLKKLLFKQDKTVKAQSLLEVSLSA